MMGTTPNVPVSGTTRALATPAIAEVPTPARHPLPRSFSSEADRTLVERLTTFFQPPSDVL